MREVGDASADKAVGAVMEKGGLASINRLLRGIVENDDLVPDTLPPAIRRYLVATAKLPPWADPAQIAAGQELFCRLGPQIVLALHCAALPNCYAGAKGANALYLTHGMTEFVHRRIIETAQFVIDVMEPGGLGEGGRGVRTTQKVRLLHGALRHILRSDPRYRPEWGAPINQEDMAGTLMAFSVVTLDALKQLGMALHPDEEEAYVHAWRVVGHVLGLHPTLIPKNAAEGRALFATIRGRQFAPSEAGRELTRALIDYLRHAIPGTMFDGFATVMIRHLVGDEVADLLEVERGDWTRALLGPMRVLFGLEEAVADHSSAIGKLTGTFSRKMLEGLLWVERGGQRAQFRIPKNLRDEWRLPPN
jgi:hypothetical protein